MPGLPSPARPSTMSTSLLLALLPPLLLVVQATLNVPQLVRLFRNQHAGVPLVGEALSLLAGAGWLVWAALARDGAMVVSAVLALAGFGPSTWVLLRAGHPWRLAAGLAGALTLGAGVGLAVGGITVLGGVLTGLAVVQYGAYMAEAFRCRDWSGYSVTSGVLRVCFGAGWALYGHLRATPVLVLWGVLTVVTFSATLGRALWWRPPGTYHARPWSPLVKDMSWPAATWSANSLELAVRARSGRRTTRSWSARSR